MHLLVRHEVADFAKWKSVYDDHLAARQTAGLKEIHLWRNVENPNEVILLFSVEDLTRRKRSPLRMTCARRCKRRE
jgi:hypothetical protein